jgi:vacuolar-type H+-ATPase subunit D/Vma8
MENTGFETSMKSLACIEISKRDLIRLRDRINNLDAGMLNLEGEQRALQKRFFELIREIEVLKAFFDASFGEHIRSSLDAEETQTEKKDETYQAQKAPNHITLGINEITREKILTIMDVIKHISDESQGSASKELVQSRVEEIGISGEDFEEVLSRLRRAGALRESDGKLQLI